MTIAYFPFEHACHTEQHRHDTDFISATDAVFISQACDFTESHFALK